MAVDSQVELDNSSIQVSVELPQLTHVIFLLEVLQGHTDGREVVDDLGQELAVALADGVDSNVHDKPFVCNLFW